MGVRDSSKNLLGLEFPAYPSSSKRIVSAKCISFSGKFHARIQGALKRTTPAVDSQQRHLDVPLSETIVGIFHASIFHSVLEPRDKAYSISPSSTRAYVACADILDSPSTSESKQ